jgi:hypothetical protein
VDALYQLLKSRQMSAAHASLAGEGGVHKGIEFEQDIENMFYGARQFCIRDLNGCGRGTAGASEQAAAASA